MKNKLITFMMGIMLMFTGLFCLSACQEGAGDTSSANTLTVTLNYNNGGYRLLQKREGTKVDLTKYHCERPGYSFAGWDHDHSKPIDKDTIINALWENNKYKIFYHSNNGDNSVIEQEVTYNHSVTLKADIFTNNGFKLKYWSTTANNDGTEFELSQVINNYYLDGDLHLYAQWEQFDETKCKMSFTGTFPSEVFWNPDTSTNAMIVDIPKVTALSVEDDTPMDVGCNITAPNGTMVMLNEYESGQGKDDICYFLATMQGSYKIRYIATDAYANQYQMNLTISVGDCEKPTLYWINGCSTLRSLNLYQGDFFKVDLTQFELSDDCSDLEYLLENLSIKLVKPDGPFLPNTATASNNFAWHFEEVGHYSLKVILKDEAGNQNVYVYSIVINPLPNVEE